MAIGCTAAQQAMLDNTFGATAGAASPANWALALFTADPTDPDSGAVEADDTTCPGYARVAFAQAAWADASDVGVKSTTAPLEFADATAEWTLTLTHWGIGPTGFTDPVDVWVADILPDPLDVTAAGTGPTVAPSVFFADLSP